MDITVEYIKDKFDNFNRQIFSGELPPIPVLLSSARTFLGRCEYKRKRNRQGKTVVYDFRLRISCRFQLKEEELEDIVIHEMIHYYIAINQLKDTSVHGTVFRRMMNEINQRHGRHVRISHKLRKEDRTRLADSTVKPRIVAVVHFKDGRWGLKVLPKKTNTVHHYCCQVERLAEVEDVRLYISSDPFFGRYPSSGALKVYWIDDAALEEHLNDATPIGFKDKSICHNEVEQCKQR